MLSPEQQRRRAGITAGCYQVRGWDSSWGVSRIRLDTIRLANGEFALHVLSARSYPETGAGWYPWGIDTVIAVFPGLAFSEVILRQGGDTLRGQSTSGGDLGLRTYSKEAHANRVAC